jgi:flagellar basal-body rod protein FlgG
MIQNIMDQASDASLRQLKPLDAVTVNFANMQTNGYKAHRFEHYLQQDGVMDSVERVDFSQGDLLMTKRQLDMGIKGQGFIPVTQPDGTVAYTRDGSFRTNQDGFLVTNRGDMVGDGIQIPLEYESILVEPTGEVKIRKKGELDPQLLGKITLVNFSNPEGLKQAGDNKLLATAASGAPSITTNAIFRQGFLEKANFVAFDQIEQVLRLNGVFVANSRMIKFTDDLFRQATSLRQ